MGFFRKLWDLVLSLLHPLSLPATAPTPAQRDPDSGTARIQQGPRVGGPPWKSGEAGPIVKTTPHLSEAFHSLPSIFTLIPLVLTEPHETAVIYKEREDQRRKGKLAHIHTPIKKQQPTNFGNLKSTNTHSFGECIPSPPPVPDPGDRGRSAGTVHTLTCLQASLVS